MKEAQYRILYSGGYFVPQFNDCNGQYTNFATIFGNVKKYTTLVKAEKFINKKEMCAKKRIEKWYIIGKVVKEL